MAVTEDRPAPYAPASAIIEIVNRYRSRGLPFPVNADVLARIGISSSLIARTLYALQILDLINESGNPTDTLEGLRLAPEAEYKSRFADWLKKTYAGIFQIVDPSKDDSVRIRDAFRTYQPVGQQNRMVSLFEALCAEAGLIPEKQKLPVIRVSGNLRASNATVSASARQYAKPAAKLPAKNKIPAGLPPALTGLLESLPETGAGWTQEDREKFLKTFATVLDFCFPITPEGKETATD